MDEQSKQSKIDEHRKTTAKNALKVLDELSDVMPAAPEFDKHMANLQHIEEELMEWGGITDENED